jgi:hypothetical protein
LHGGAWMTLLAQLEHELDRVQKQLRRLTREQAVLTEQITRLRTGAPPEVVCAALQVAFGVRLDVYLLSHGGDADQSVPPSPGLRSLRPDSAERGPR